MIGTAKKDVNCDYDVTSTNELTNQYNTVDEWSTDKDN